MNLVASNPQAYIKSMLKLGLSHEKNNRPNDAIAAYQTLLGKHPNNEEAIIRISNIFNRYQEYENALKSLNYYLKITPNKHIAYYELGLVYERLYKHDEAFSAYISACKAKPTFPNVYAPLSLLAQKLKRIEELSDFIEGIFESVKKVAELHWMKAVFHTENRNYTSAIESFSKANSLGIHKSNQARFYEEYARVNAKLERFDEAMALYTKSQSIASKERSAIAVDDRLSTQFINQSINGFNNLDVNSWQPSPVNTEHPAFLVGFPRSGTTLMEQILSSHPTVTVSDEIQVLTQLALNFNKALGRNINYPKDLHKLTSDDIQNWRQAYYKNMRTQLHTRFPNKDDISFDFSNASNGLLVDKNPMTFTYIGLIKRFFPDSPIIMMIRDPRDVCLSCFFQSFTPNVSTINFFSLKKTVNYYARTMSLYLSLKQKLSLNILEVKYEELCSDPLPHAKSVLEHLELPWDDNIMRFHTSEHARVISTPSFDAVSKPINTKAVGNWKNYEKYLEPHMASLQPFLEAFSYD